MKFTWNIKHKTCIPKIQLSEIYEIFSLISVKFLDILLVLEEFQDISPSLVGFKNLTSENFKKIQKTH